MMRHLNFVLNGTYEKPVSPDYDPLQTLKELNIKNKEVIKLKHRFKSNEIKTIIKESKDYSLPDEFFLYYGYYSITDEKLSERFRTILPFLGILPIELEKIIDDKAGWDINHDGKMFQVHVSEKVTTSGKIPIMVDLRQPKKMTNG